MPYNGSGQFSPTNAGYSGEDIWARAAAANENVRADRFDAFTDDIKEAFENVVTRDGQNSPSENLPMADHRHTGVGDGEDRSDYAALGQLRDSIVRVAPANVGGTASAITLAPSARSHRMAVPGSSSSRQRTT